MYNRHAYHIFCLRNGACIVCYLRSLLIARRHIYYTGNVISMKYMFIILQIYIKNKHADVVINSFFKYIFCYLWFFNCSVTTCQEAYITFKSINQWANVGLNLIKLRERSWRATKLYIINNIIIRVGTQYAEILL